MSTSNPVSPVNPYDQFVQSSQKITEKPAPITKVNKIYYFSGTGNSLLVARKLASRLSKPWADKDPKSGADMVVLETQLVPIVSALHVPPSDEKISCLGLVLPVYMSNPPHIVLDFIAKMPKADYVFVVLTCGMMVGDALYKVQSAIDKTKNRMNAGYVIPLISNFIVLPKTKSDKKVDASFSKIDDKINFICKNVETGFFHMDKQTTPFLTKPINWAAFDTMYEKVPELDKKFTVNDSCTSCGTCVNVCPVDNIDLKDGKPEWNHRCEMCFACINWCPESAINWTKFTEKKKRYQCRGMTPTDLILK
ncbi:hypothetical protein MsAg5_07760 [Methanosarcinaceae archaeon Ag5]|uniref:4Fe-4S ferredoxin-type domain-containing protein n=1 Tax=Methanolapillus africanus TaxID=3028297 RepID=A0AAE4MJS3_9EURY|nr:hypothetical protein [Methanosarcinaceae archaeon Ag5]